MVATICERVCRMLRRRGLMGEALPIFFASSWSMPNQSGQARWLRPFGLTYEAPTVQHQCM